MHHFFADPSRIEGGLIRIEGQDCHHLRDVLRIRRGERVLVSDGQGTDYECEVEGISDKDVLLRICFKEAPHELPAEIWLFQGIPKTDKMELIVQKAVELGAHVIVPLETRNTVVKLDRKRAEAKQNRWQAIAEAAAKQSKRSLLPVVHSVMSWQEAMKRMGDFRLALIPYENADNVGESLQIFQEVKEIGRRAAGFRREEGHVFLPSFAPLPGRESEVNACGIKKNERQDFHTSFAPVSTHESEVNACGIKKNERQDFHTSFASLSSHESDINADFNACDIKSKEESNSESNTASRIALFIGPEGGFSETEIKDALSHNIRPITLGKRILRTETASICAMSLLMAALECGASI